MEPKFEKKVLREFLKIIDTPKEAEKKFLNGSRIAMTVGALLLFLLWSDNVDAEEGAFLFAACAFAAGMAFGLAIWFLQAGTQTAVMVRHMSGESIAARLREIDQGVEMQQ